MIDLVIDVDFPDLSVTRYAEGRLAREAGRAAMNWFVRVRLGHRFDGSLRSELRLSPREASYVNSSVWFQGRTRKHRVGTGQEHHFSGGTEKRAEQGTVYASLRRFGLLITGLNAGYGRRRGSQINLRSELQRMTEGERRELAVRYADSMARGLMALWERARAKERL